MAAANPYKILKLTAHGKPTVKKVKVACGKQPAPPGYLDGQKASVLAIPPERADLPCPVHPIFNPGIGSVGIVADDEDESPIGQSGSLSLPDIRNNLA